MATDTVYGLHCSAGNEQSVSRLRAVKGSGPRPFILLLAGPDQLDEFAQQISSSARRLAEAYWPGPLTLVFRAAASTPEWLVGPGDTVAMRCPGDALCAPVLERLGSPLVSTSANTLGGTPCLSGAEAAEEFLDRVDVVVDSGPAPSEVPSTIVDVTVFPHKLIRQGGLAVKPGLLGAAE